MVEVVFGSSAHGSLRLAEGFEKGEVFGFALDWSVGGIADDTPGEARRDVLRRLCTVALPDGDMEGQLACCVEEGAASLGAVRSRAAAGEKVRAWFSSKPDELCGFCWLMAQLDGLDFPAGMVWLPQRVEKPEEGVLVGYNGWNEVAPEEWQGFACMEKPLSPLMRSAAAWRWRELKEENAPLRAIVNGEPVSVPEDFYDCFLRAELPEIGEEFLQGRMVGRILSRFQLGISDRLIAMRLDAMIQAGVLEIAREEPEGEPSHRRMLRRVR